jgi:hypothetical protein
MGHPAVIAPKIKIPALSLQERRDKDGAPSGEGISFRLASAFDDLLGGRVPDGYIVIEI